MRLLLHLLALIAGFNGLIAGPAAARASQPAVIVAPAPGSVEQTRESAAVRHVAAPLWPIAAAPAQADARAPFFAPQTHPVDERRIE